jgi:hypothetical protein
MSDQGKFSFTYNGQHWVWVDSKNKYESRGFQPKNENNNNNNNNNNGRPRSRNQRGGNRGFGNGEGLATLAMANWKN